MSLKLSLLLKKEEIRKLSRVSNVNRYTRINEGTTLNIIINHVTGIEAVWINNAKNLSVDNYWLSMIITH